MFGASALLTYSFVQIAERVRLVQQRALAVVQQECAPAFEQLALAANAATASRTHRKGASSGVDAARALQRCFIDCRTLHLTLFVLHIANEHEMRMYVRICERCSRMIYTHTVFKVLCTMVYNPTVWKSLTEYEYSHI